VVVACLTLCILGLEEEAATSRLEADELCRRLNDLEDRSKALARAALDAVWVVRPEGHLFSDRLRSLLRQVRGRQHASLGAGSIRLGSGLVGAWVPYGDHPPGAEGAHDRVRRSRYRHHRGGRCQ
jgi:hypothetical protein